MNYVKTLGKSIQSSDDLSSKCISKGSLAPPLCILNIIIFWYKSLYLKTKNRLIQQSTDL